MKPLRTSEELLRFGNHPLRSARRVCPKCKGINVMAPSYPGDYFDCLDCGHAIAPTAKQIEAMRNPNPSHPMKSCPPPSMFSPAPAQEAPALPLECVIGYPPSPAPKTPSLGRTIGFGLAMGVALASIGIAVATLLFL